MRDARDFEIFRGVSSMQFHPEPAKRCEDLRASRYNHERGVS